MFCKNLEKTGKRLQIHIRINWSLWEDQEDGLTAVERHFTHDLKIFDG